MENNNYQTDYQLKLHRLSYLIQLLTFFITTKERDELQQQLKNKIAELAKGEVQGTPNLKVL